MTKTLVAIERVMEIEDWSAFKILLGLEAKTDLVRCAVLWSTVYRVRCLRF
jgi:hypothetical protein